MRYVAVLKGDASVLQLIAPCFVGNEARITKLGETWVLESASFSSCTRPRDVFPIADAVLTRIHRILALYCGLHAPLSVHYIQSFDAEGAPSKRGIRASFSGTVYSAKGLAELVDPSGEVPLGSAIFQRAVCDSAVVEALSLWGEREVGWSQIYDIIEFVGGPDEIAQAGWATKEQSRAIRRTANHYRHLGSPRKYPLPVAAPSIVEARTFARNLLKSWMTSRSR